MWHFGKGQALRLGCPSIFITSPLVIWKLASPIFVSPLSLAAPAILSYIVILLLFSVYFFFHLSPLIFCSSFPPACHVFCFVNKRGSCFVNMETRFHTHTYRNTLTCTRPQGCCGGPGTACQHQL